jgi:hypothetical protein
MSFEYRLALLPELDESILGLDIDRMQIWVAVLGSITS